MPPPEEFPVYAVTIFCLIPAVLTLFLSVSAGIYAPEAPPQGCRKLGKPKGSNIADEHDYDERGLRKDSKENASNKSGGGRRQGTIKALIAYPLKSCAGIEFTSADVTATGLRYDRSFTIAEYEEDAPSASGDKSQKGRWEMRTLRKGSFSKLALIRPEIWVPDRSSDSYSSWNPEVRSNGVLVINYPRAKTNPVVRLLIALGVCPPEHSFRVPLDPPDDEQAYPRFPLHFINFTTGVSYAKHIPASLSTFLGSTKPLTIFRTLPSHPRPVVGNARDLGEQLGFEPTMGFADEYPLQVQNLASIRAMAERVGTDAIPRFSVRRFRPNIVLEGLPAFEEDTWTKVRFHKSSSTSQEKKSTDDDGVLVHVCCHTVRCKLPNVDPDTGIRHAVEPDKTLRTTRSIDPGAKGSGCLGMMMVPAERNFKLSVGDELEVVETGEHFYKSK